MDIKLKSVYLFVNDSKFIIKYSVVSHLHPVCVFYLLFLLPISTVPLVAAPLSSGETMVAEATSLASLQAQWKVIPLLLDVTNIPLLQRHGLLTPLQAQAFIDCTNKHGNFATLDDLIVLPHWTQATLNVLRPYVVMPNKQSSKKQKPEGKHKKNRKSPTNKKKKKSPLAKKQPIHQVTLSFSSSEKSKGNELGTPYEIADIYKISAKGDYVLEFLGNKGQGEPMRYAYRRFYALVEDKPPIKRLVIGKYSIKLGQGLILGNSSDKNDIKHHFSENQDYLKPVKSKKRNDGFTGIGVHLVHGSIDCIIAQAHNAYYALLREEKPKKKNNNKPLNDINSNNEHRATTKHVRSIGASHTFFRTEKDWETKRGFEEQSSMIALIHTITKQTKLGMQYITHHYNLPFRKQKVFSGTMNSNASLWGEFKYNNNHLRTEIAFSPHNGIGFFVGNKLALSAKEYLIFALQHYNTHFCSLHGNQETKCQGYPEQHLSIASKHTLGATTTLEQQLHCYRTQSKAVQKNYQVVYMLSHMHKLAPSTSLSADLKVNHKPKEMTRGSYTLTGAHQYTPALGTSINLKTTMQTPKKPWLALTLSSHITYNKGPWKIKVDGKCFLTFPLLFLQASSSSLSKPSSPQSLEAKKIGLLNMSSSYAFNSSTKLDISLGWDFYNDPKNNAQQHTQSTTSKRKNKGLVQRPNGNPRVKITFFCAL